MVPVSKQSQGRPDWSIGLIFFVVRTWITWLGREEVTTEYMSVAVA